MRLNLFSVVVAFGWLVACGDADRMCGPGGESSGCDGSGGTVPGGSGGGGTGGSGGIGGSGGAGGAGGIWSECPEGSGACTSFEVPLDWEAPDGEKIPLFVRRLASSRQPAAGQLWVMPGGPGTAGWNIAGAESLFNLLAPDHDIYIADYRGTGHSAWLGCTEVPDGTLTAACFAALEQKWGAGLAHFSTGAAARDLHHAIEALREPAQRVLLWSNSYGTYVANRLLTLFPDVADAAVMDSVCHPTGCDVRTDRNTIDVARRVFAACGDDAECSNALGTEPFDRFVALLDAAENGHCPAFFGNPLHREIFPYLVLGVVKDRVIAPLAPAIVYRAERCHDGDVEALEHLVGEVTDEAVAALDAMPSGEVSDYLRFQIMFSEFWPADLDPAAVEDEVAALPFAIGFLQDWSAQRETWPWPLYSTPALEERWSGTAIPLLLMNGDLDTSTPISELGDVEATFVGPAQQLVRFPFTGHGVTSNSGAATGARLPTCGVELTKAFFADPTAPVDDACVREAALNFRGDPGLAIVAFGTADLWENDLEVVRLGASMSVERGAVAGSIRRLLEQRAPW